MMTDGHAMTPMMVARKAAIDGMAAGMSQGSRRWQLRDLEIDAAGSVGDTIEIDSTLVARIVDSLIGSVAPRAALVRGLSESNIDAVRAFHRRLFGAVWSGFRERSPDVTSTRPHRTKDSVIADGRIPIELHGSAWSFKKLHADRDVLLFSHVYGPVAGFAGGDILLVDVAGYAGAHALDFDALCEWSDEPTEGSKPVVRAAHEQALLDEVGITVPAPGPAEILFINNGPSAGLFHGVTPVSVLDRDSYVRDYHRCAAKEIDEP